MVNATISSISVNPLRLDKRAIYFTVTVSDGVLEGMGRSPEARIVSCCRATVVVPFPTA